MAAQFYSKICTHAHTAMEELFSAGLIDAQSMFHFDVLCRADVQSHSPYPPFAPWLRELRAEMASTEKNYAPVLTAKAKLAPQLAQAKSVKTPTASAAQPPAVGASAKQPVKEVRIVRAASTKHAPRPKPVAPTPSTTKKEAPKAPAPNDETVRPKPRPVLPKTKDWQFPQPAQSFQSVALAARAEPAPAGASKQPTQRQRSAAELRALREREGVSEAVFARCLGVPPQTVIAWEDGVVLPSPKVSRMLTTIEEKGLNAVG